MNKLTLLYLFLPLLAFTGLYGQVTIGADLQPVNGAVLDLKQMQKDDGSENSILGLSLPRVNLTNLKPTVATGTNSLPVSIGAAASEDWDLSAHTGLVVYNIKEDLCAPAKIYKGCYVWTGTEWDYLGRVVISVSPDVHTFTDPRDGEKYLYRTFGAAGVWMLENLRYIPDTADGYPNYTENLAAIPSPYTAKYYTFVVPDRPYNPSTAKTTWENGYKRYGIRYNFPATINVGNGSGITVTNPTGHEAPSSTPPLRRGVCPPGWHVPSMKEWVQLRDEIINYTPKYANEAAGGDKTRVGAAMTSPCVSLTGGMPGTSYTPEMGGFYELCATWWGSPNGGTYISDGVRYARNSFGQASAYAAGPRDAYTPFFEGAGDRETQMTIRCKKDAP